MKNAHHKVKHNMTILRAVLIALCTSLMVTAILSTLCAYMVWSETISQSAMNGATIALRLVSMVVGGVISTAISDEKKAVASAATIGVYTLILVCANLLFMDGRVGDVAFGIGSAVFAWVAAIGIFAGFNRSYTIGIFW